MSISSLTLAGAAALSAFHVQKHTPSIAVSATESLVDQEVAINLKSLRPYEIIQIKAQTTDDSGVVWSSEATFMADERGNVDLSVQAPLKGFYEGVDGMGLFWSMQPIGNEGASFKVKKDSFAVTLTAWRGQEKLTTLEMIRWRKDPNVSRVVINEDGLVGVLFLPLSQKPLPVIIALTGSNGGLAENRAQLLASHGFAVLALGYFGIEGLPANLQEIPMEYFEGAFKWLKAQPNIDGSRIGIYGVSRGGELSLILGSLFPESIQAISAIVPSSVVYPGLNEKPVDAWVFKGKPISTYAPVPEIDFSQGLGKDPSCPANSIQVFFEGMKNKEAFAAAAIPVEKITASLFLASGGDDQMWPSTFYSEEILRRLDEKKSSIKRTHLNYPKAGHGINIPNLPQPGPVYFHPGAKRWFSMGGTPVEDQKASQDSWNKMIAFFKESLAD